MCGHLLRLLSLPDDGLLEGLPTSRELAPYKQGVFVCVCVCDLKTSVEGVPGISYYSHFTGFSVAQLLARTSCLKKPV